MKIKKHFNQKSHALTHNHLLRRKLFVVVGGSFVVMVVLYAYFLSVNVIHVIVKASYERESRAIMSEKSVLERVYLEKIKGISYSYAESLGYMEVTNTYFAPRSAYAQAKIKGRHEL